MPSQQCLFIPGKMICHLNYCYNFLGCVKSGWRKWITKGWRHCTARISNNYTSNTHKVCRVQGCFLWNTSNHTNDWLTLDCDGYLPMNSAHPLRDQLGDKQHHHWSLDAHLQLATDALTTTLTHTHLQLQRSQEEKRSLNRESWEADQCSWSYSID